MKRSFLFFYKLRHWEYWPFAIIQFPIFFVWLYYSLKAKSLFFYNASNPSIKNGGLLMEPKNEVYELIPKEFIPKTIFIKKNTEEQKLIETFVSANISFPCIVKPNLGSKGRGIEKTHTLAKILEYARLIQMDFLIQEFIDYKQEMGIFYCKMPNQKHGVITGIVAKEFMTVTGNGRHTIQELLKQNPRYCLQLNALKIMHGEKLSEILTQGKNLQLADIGNHARGSKFLDVSHWADETLTKTTHKICSQIPSFYFGRLDVKYNTLEELKQGKNFSIIELNGAGSEPTHIYDPTHSLFFAWKETARHIKMLYQVSTINHQKGHSYLALKQGLEMFRDNKKLDSLLNQYQYMPK